MSKSVELSEALLHRLYLKEKKPIREIAKQLGFGEATIFSYLKKYKIPTRSKDAHKLGKVFSKETRDKIRHKALGRKHSLKTREKMSKKGKGKKHWWAKRKVWHKEGYIMLFLPEHLNANTSGYVAEHRKLMADKLKRPLKDDEIVHHINGVKDDNRIKNLILTSRTEHKYLHQAEIICPFCQSKFQIRNGRN